MSAGDILQGWHPGDVLLAAAALRTGLLEAVGEQGNPGLAASALGLELRATRTVCGALADAVPLADDGGRWSVSDRGRHLLTPAEGAPDLAGEQVGTERSIAAHTRLADVLAGPVEVEDASTWRPGDPPALPGGDAPARRPVRPAGGRRGRAAHRRRPAAGRGAPGTTAGAFTSRAGR